MENSLEPNILNSERSLCCHLNFFRLYCRPYSTFIDSGFKEEVTFYYEHAEKASRKQSKIVPRKNSLKNKNDYYYVLILVFGPNRRKKEFWRYITKVEHFEFDTVSITQRMIFGQTDIAYQVLSNKMINYFVRITSRVLNAVSFNKLSISGKQLARIMSNVTQANKLIFESCNLKPVKSCVPNLKRRSSFGYLEINLTNQEDIPMSFTGPEMISILKFIHRSGISKFVNMIEFSSKLGLPESEDEIKLLKRDLGFSHTTFKIWDITGRPGWIFFHDETD
ncbi:unnamed protein product [Moneuplotes crassus]|uniref:Uncharacterized protein n=1 Tax=Euplotes crassus TaxID=5936 RepID=A0AAD2CZX8_EUPCR|nr:unnamed protein product [Moneuplotes crassus]